ncbi:hypothetical protein OIDMADRAFT_101848 [Oidiodendron maius Zn]|uniref:MPR-like GPCR protein n=1 Tax=Oidiodendron maius (strain Zn) TaxID=913774 RepID=A0A0C3H9S2_OIDMZ|nr:hypothetical protein OIDMADRAFT_101848 [Oidiodendron maius Zn]
MDSNPSTRPSRRPTLSSFEELPKWYQDNPFILRGYRPVSDSFRLCWESWFYLHNETVNIFSHLVPAIYFLTAQWLISRYLSAHYPDSSVEDRRVFAFFLLTVTVCFGLSSAYHTLMNHSFSLSHLFLSLDLVGIVVHILGNFVSGIYVIFYCEPTLQRLYWTMIITLCSAMILLTVNSKLQGKSWRTFRVCTFVATALSGFAPLIHGVLYFGFSHMVRHSGMPYYLAEGLLYVVGALFYAMRIPEAFKPGEFDTFGSSHQIFHIFTVLASVVHATGVLTSFNYNYHNRRTCATHRGT